MIPHPPAKTDRLILRAALGFPLAVLLLIAVQVHGLAAPSAQPSLDVATAEIRQFTFSPSPLVVATGAVVTWTNRDAIEHSVTSGSPDAPSGVFDSDFISPEQSFSFRFDEPGEYPYFCRRHPFMHGTLIVS